ncbi:MAG: pyridoxal phosphate-dependent aminotransferase [Sedimenticola sp.]|nr:pyridoxal phosphate-dependent aminotransferase [Sedimenticola sp.]
MIAERMASISPFYVMELLARARALEGEGRSIIHMEVGEPDFETPRPIIEAGKRALDQGFTHYTPAVGIRELREAIAQDYFSRFCVKLNPDRVLITPGSSGALQLIMSTVINPGQAVMMADPGYPCNRNFVKLVSGIPVTVPVGAETGYQLTAEIIDREWSENTRAVMVATPSNPTGTILSRQQLEAIYQVVKARGGVLIVDEIYQGLVYDVKPFTALEITDDLFIINSFSKYYGMTGWRLGWMIAPERFISAADKLAQNIFLAASTPAQYAALAAFEEETQRIVEERREAFRERRDYLLPALQQLGFEFPVVPAGAFYLYTNCRSITEDSFSFAHELLETEGVAVTPGRDFGDYLPEQHIRFAYTTALEKLQEGVARIARFIKC